jgi:hypothetical protein
LNFWSLHGHGSLEEKFPDELASDSDTPHRKNRKTAFIQNVWRYNIVTFPAAQQSFDPKPAELKNSQLSQKVAIVYEIGCAD